METEPFGSKRGELTLFADEARDVCAGATVIESPV